jgi:hypothetical protein
MTTQRLSPLTMLLSRHTRRRQFITLLGGVAASWPLAANAQQGGTAVVGYLHSGAAAPFAHLLAVFREALRYSGYVEGQNLAIEYRWANGEYDRLQALATELVQRQVAVIVTARPERRSLARARVRARARRPTELMRRGLIGLHRWAARSVT